MRTPIPSDSSTITASPTSPAGGDREAVVNRHSRSAIGNDVIEALVQDAATDRCFLGHRNAFDGVLWREDLDGREVMVDGESGEPLKMWLAGEISTRQFWLQPCGMWSSTISSYRDGHNRTSGFESHVATAYVTEPFTTPLKALHKAAVTNVAKFIKEQKKVSENGDLVDSTNHLKIRHKIFDQVDPDDQGGDDSDEDGDDTASDNDSIEWTMANWPCKTEDAIRARDQLAKTGRYIPRLLAAYDVTRTLIEPLKYEAKLKGALAKVVVSISRWCIQKEYTYCADIVEIHLLREPVALVNSGTPQKKKKVVRPSAPAHSPHKPGERY